MSKPSITWFCNDQEHRLHYVKYGLMRLARMGEIRFREIPIHSASDIFSDPAGIDHCYGHTVVIRIEETSKKRLVILDGEDSFFQISPLIQWCDVYFSCTYSQKFFHHELFDCALPWQTECEIQHYRELYVDLQQRYAWHLHKAKPLMPMGPAMEWTLPLPYLNQKAWGLRHKISKLAGPSIDWGIQFARFEKRWDHLHRLRALQPIHDVVLKDSLWGWPRHRTALHRELARLAPHYDIRSELHYRAAEAYELGDHHAPDFADFPLISGGGVAGDYEEMLAQSRLGVFATGFHYGCRNIVTLAWFLGLRTLSDPFSFEAIYDFEKLGVATHLSGNWSEIEPQIEQASLEPVGERIRRQKIFDDIAGPERAAREIVEAAFCMA